MGLEKAVRKKKRVKIIIYKYPYFREELWRTKKTINELRGLPIFISDLKLELYEDTRRGPRKRGKRLYRFKQSLSLIPPTSLSVGILGV